MLFLPDGTPEQMAWYEDLLWRFTTAEAAAALYGALLACELDGSDVLARTSVPVLVSHGRDDMIVLPSMAERTLAACPAATLSWYDGVGHMPFWEAPDRFNRELADLARHARSSQPALPTPYGRCRARSRRIARKQERCRSDDARRGTSASW